ncbi:MAG: WXG100 family type VII secretion target [Caldilineaceae bacterium]|nr:WXG100 family type VII secretion target [Caldilineaceae bacterium]MCB0123702.1 WXG100 family type VII secretion target [Caldilineaceae bacterium]HRW06764.1 WXG100 family type VII secretion target [Caldilineaceae bacterium]
MADKIKLDYRLAEEMIKTFHKGHQQLQQTATEMQNVANLLESGALLGRGGDAFKDAVRSKLIKSINNLNAKFKELEGDVHKAVQYMQQADRESSGKFR